MLSKQLDARKKAILYVAVQEYILTAEPVSSQRLVEKYQLGVSSATVRNELAALEDMGYLHQPHTSAGRIPTDAAYRYYVDCTSSKPGLTCQEEQAITEIFSALNREMEDLLQETTKVLSDLTRQVSVVLAPSFKKSKIKHIDMVAISSKFTLLVLITDNGQVLKRSLSLNLEDTSVEFLEKFLNQKLQGLTLNEISNLKEALVFDNLKTTELVYRTIDEIIKMMQDEDKERVYLSGTTSIFGQPEFDNLQKVQSLLDSLQESYKLLKWLEDSFRTEKVIVRIGSENTDQQIKECSVIASSYHVDGEAIGTIGVIGPTRMNYARAISSVALIADNLSKALKELRA